MATPLSIPCPQVIDCPCSDDPISNYSSETPDQPVFFGHYYQPPTAGTWFAPGCLGVCESFVSQQAADECAARQAIECSFDGAPSGGNPLPDGIVPAARFGNTFQSCDAECEGGAGTVTALVAPGTVISATQADADARAHGLACQEAQRLRVCFSTLSPLDPVCVDAFMSVVFDAYGGTPPYSFAGTSGSISPGTELNAEGNLFGTPTATGTYTFTVAVTDDIGTTVSKQFTLIVTTITPANPASASIAVPYSQMLMLDGAVGTVTWAVIAGSLPDGLTLDASTGVISGTPSLSAVTSAFTVAATEA